MSDATDMPEVIDPGASVTGSGSGRARKRLILAQLVLGTVLLLMLLGVLSAGWFGVDIYGTHSLAR